MLVPASSVFASMSSYRRNRKFFWPLRVAIQLTTWSRQEPVLGSNSDAIKRGKNSSRLQSSEITRRRSDLPNNRIMKWEEETGHVIVFRKPSNYANGNTQDRQGRLVTCEHGTRRVTRTEHDGSLTVILDRFDGKPLNSPNDVVVKSDGSIWFSDPPFGIAEDYKENAAPAELPQNLYRVDGETGQATVVAGDLRGPNGLCFSPDETKLYVVESRATPNRLIQVYDVTNGRKLVNDRAFVDAGPGTPDGLRADIDGNLWCGWGMGTAELDGVFHLFA